MMAALTDEESTANIGLIPLSVIEIFKKAKELKQAMKDAELAEQAQKSSSLSRETSQDEKEVMPSKRN